MSETSQSPWPITCRFAGEIPLYGAKAYADHYNLSVPQRNGLGALDLLSRGMDPRSTAKRLNLPRPEMGRSIDDVCSYFHTVDICTATAKALRTGALPTWAGRGHLENTTKEETEACFEWVKRNPTDILPSKVREVCEKFNYINELHLLRDIFSGYIKLKPYYYKDVGRVAHNAFKPPAYALFSLPPRAATPTPYRQKQVLEGLSYGLSRKVAASGLGIKPNSVKTHTTHLFTRYLVQSAEEATTKGIILGDLPISRREQSIALSPVRLYTSVCIALGPGNKEIAQRAGFSVHTAKTHTVRIRNQLDRFFQGLQQDNPDETPFTVRSRTSIIRALFELGVFGTEQHEQQYSMHSNTENP